MMYLVSRSKIALLLLQNASLPMDAGIDLAP